MVEIEAAKGFSDGSNNGGRRGTDDDGKRECSAGRVESLEGSAQKRPGIKAKKPEDTERDSSLLVVRTVEALFLVCRHSRSLFLLGTSVHGMELWGFGGEQHRVLSRREQQQQR